jgi:hypothetical protein
MDEQQDMKPLYYALVRKFLRDLRVAPSELRVAVFGDAKQSIYEFMRADSRFLTFASQLLGPDVTDGAWSERRIRTSFRVTRSMAAFINCVDRRAERQEAAVVAVKDGPPVRYRLCDLFGRGPADEVWHYLDAGYAPQDIFVLAPSIKSDRGPAHHLENALVRCGIPCYASPGSEDAAPDQDVIAGKVAFCTFHQAKGLERPVVLVLGFDDSYVEFYCKCPRQRLAAQSECPNPMYVALSRAKERLTVFHHRDARRKRSRPCFPGVDARRLRELVRADHVQWVAKRRLLRALGPYVPLAPQDEERSSWSVTDLLRHTPDQAIAACFGGPRPLVSLVSLAPLAASSSPAPAPRLNIPSKVPSGWSGMHEPVADLTGLAIPSIFELRCRGTSAILEDMQVRAQGELDRYRVADAADADAAAADADADAAVHRHLRLVTRYDSKHSGFHARREQIARYEWLDARQTREACRRLERMVAACSPVGIDRLVFERPYCVRSSRLVPGVSVGLVGRADMQAVVGGGAIWELKCVDSLQPEHALQLIVYAWMMMMEQQAGAGGSEPPPWLERDVARTIEQLPLPAAVARQVQGFVGRPAPRMYLFNICTDELLEVVVNGRATTSMGRAEDVVRLLVRTKLAADSRCSDEAFLLNQRQLVRSAASVAAAAPAAPAASVAVDFR